MNDAPLTHDETELITAAWEVIQAAGGDTIAPDVSLSHATVVGPPSETLPPVGSAPAADVSHLQPLGLGSSGGFEQGELLGRGGMGEVHVARDHALERDVALKTLGRDPTEHTRRALLQEARFTGYVEHPNVVPVHRLGTDASGRPAFVMQRVSGSSWRDLLRDPEHPVWENLPSDRLRANLEILTQVCNAVHYAHSRGVLHRDIKPDNVMVGRFGEVYLLDWGLALRLEDAEAEGTAIVGTLAYMAPEMLGDAEKLSPRTDVYLLGATLHEVLTGKTRHSGSAHYNVILKVVRSAQIDYGDAAPRELADLCNRATHREPAERPDSALAFRRALERFLEHRGSLSLAQEASERLGSLRAAYRAGEDGPATATLFSECRFGFQQALAIWPENEDARAGLQECLELAITRDLRVGALGRAESLLNELPTPRPELARRLSHAKAEAAKAPARLQELEEDLDFTVGARERAIIMTLMLLGAYVPTGALPFLLAPRGPLPVTFGTFGGLLLGLGVFFVALLYLGRRALLRNRANRRLVGMIACGWIAVLHALVLLWVYDYTLGALFFVVGLVLVAVALQIAAVVDRRLFPVIAVSASSAWINVFYPTVDPLFEHAIFGGGALAFVTWLWWRDAKRAPLPSSDDEALQ